MSKRVSLILGDADERAIEPFLHAGTAERAALEEWAIQHAGETGEKVRSEASALRALLQVAAQALRDQVLDAGYAEFATFYESDVHGAERRTARERYAARTERPS